MFDNLLFYVSHLIVTNQISKKTVQKYVNNFFCFKGVVFNCVGKWWFSLLSVVKFPYSLTSYFKPKQEAKKKNCECRLFAGFNGKFRHLDLKRLGLVVGMLGAFGVVLVFLYFSSTSIKN